MQDAVTTVIPGARSESQARANAAAADLAPLSPKPWPPRADLRPADRALRGAALVAGRGGTAARDVA